MIEQLELFIYIKFFYWFFLFYQILTLTTAQVVETSVTVTNSSFQNYAQPDDHTSQTTKLWVPARAGDKNAFI